MSFYLWLVFNSLMLGVGLAMDAFSVSLANGFAEPKMKNKRALGIAGIYAGFQLIMPVIGWVLVHTAVTVFSGLQKFIPWIAFILLGFIGGKMLFEGIEAHRCKQGGDCENCPKKDCNVRDKSSRELSTRLLLLQGVATSIDALSVGFTIAEYNAGMVLVSALIIGAVTYVICYFGLKIGAGFGTKMSGSARILGGLILIGIGAEILIKGVFLG